MVSYEKMCNASFMHVGSGEAFSGKFFLSSSLLEASSRLNIPEHCSDWMIIARRKMHGILNRRQSVSW